MGSSADDLPPQTVEHSIFGETSLLDVENLGQWVAKSEGLITTSDGIIKNLINHKSDPLLNQMHCNNKSSDEMPDETTKSVKKKSSLKVDRNMNKLRKEKIEKSMHRINDILLKIKAGLTISFLNCDSKVRVAFCDNNKKEILPECFVPSAEIGTHFKQKEYQNVVSCNKIEIAKNIKLEIPCLVTHTGLKLYLCVLSKCNECFGRFGNAKLHTLVHIGYKPYRCDHPNCTWAFYTPFKLKRHQQTHLKKKDFICPIESCMRKFTTVYNLNIHKRLHERSADLPCPVKGCEEKFQTARFRERHLKNHDRSEAPFPCPVLNCNRTFFLNSALTAHTRTHSHKESDIRCKWPNCGMVFEHPCRLKAHQRKHTGQRPYSCTFEECKWTFSTASKLKRHQSIHTNDRKFHCTIGTCTKSFLRSEHLKEHTLTHIGQRTFVCEVCSACFLGKSTLYLHLTKCHPMQEACARALPYNQSTDKPTPDALLEQAIQSLGVPSDMILGAGLLPEEPLELLANENFSTVNLRDLD